MVSPEWGQTMATPPSPPPLWAPAGQEYNLIHCCRLRALSRSRHQMKSYCLSVETLPPHCLLGRLQQSSLCFIMWPSLTFLYPPSHTGAARLSLSLNLCVQLRMASSRRPHAITLREKIHTIKSPVLWQEYPYKLFGLGQWGPLRNILEAKMQSIFTFVLLSGSWSQKARSNCLRLGRDWASLVAQKVEFAMQETWVQSLGQENPMEKGMATPSSILAWRIPWTEEPGRLQSMGFTKSQTPLSD